MRTAPLALDRVVWVQPGRLSVQPAEKATKEPKHRSILCATLALVTTLACCGWGDSKDPERVRVETMGWDGGTLAITYDRGDHFRVRVSDVLAEDSDPDRPVRVCIKELLRCLEYEDRPDNERPDWYLHSGDTKEPYAPFPDSEARWIASFDESWPVECVDVQWLVEAVDAACLRVNDAAGREMFKRP